MTHDRFDGIIEGLCHAYDYGNNSHMKSVEIKEMLRPLGSQIEPKTGLEALYGIIAISLKLIEELECTKVIDAEESSSQKQDLANTVKDAQLSQNKKK